MNYTYLVEGLILTVCLIVLLWYVYARWYAPLFARDFDGTKRRGRAYAEAFKTRMPVSVDLKCIAPLEILREVTWYKNYGHGWFHHLISLESSGNFEAWIADFRNVLPLDRFCSPKPIEFTLLNRAPQGAHGNPRNKDAMRYGESGVRPLLLTLSTQSGVLFL